MGWESRSDSLIDDFVKKERGLLKYSAVGSVSLGKGLVGMSLMLHSAVATQVASKSASAFLWLVTRFRPSLFVRVLIMGEGRGPAE